jgi:hypothetical protein
LFQKFAGIFAIQGAPTVSTTLMVPNFPQVSTTLTANFATGTAAVVDTGGKFATGVNDTGGKSPPVSATLALNSPPVSMTPVANNWNKTIADC